MTNESKKADFRLLILIGSQKIGAKAQQILTDNSVPVQYHIIAKGTASGEFADLIGLGGVDKSVLVCVLPKAVANQMLSKMRDRLYLGAPGTGVAFTVALSGASARILQHMQAFENKTPTTERVENDKMDNKFTMIMAFVNQGFSEEVMSAARPAGAGGGTVFHSRRVGDGDSHQFMGIAVQPEREIVLILAKKENKVAIMKAISEKCGSQSEAQGTVVSLPVDEVEGLVKDSE